MFSKLSVAAALAGLTVANAAFADHGPRSQVVFAPVLGVEPIVRQVTIQRPREECWLETSVVPGYRSPNPGAVVAGGLIGGVIGHQIGHGSANDAMTVLGTLVGSAIASDAAAKRAAYAPPREVTTQRCEIVSDAYTEDRIDGYRVTYEFMGQRYATIMPQPPRGNRVRLQVTVQASGY